MGDAKFKLEDILNKQKAQPQILDLTNVKIESEEDFKNVIEKIPDYKIKPERVSNTFALFLNRKACMNMQFFNRYYKMLSYSVSRKKRLSR